MQIAVLGSLEVTVGDGQTALNSATQRRIIGALTLRRSEVVAAERLADMADVSVVALRTAISRLRARLGDSVVTTVPEGYSLGDVVVDVDLFEAMLGRAHLASPAGALVELEAALTLWRGEPYAELGDAEWARGESARLSELHAAAVEDRTEAMINLGNFKDATAAIKAHVASHPLRDRPVGLLMRGLAAQGRRSEALQVYQTHRKVLAEEVGLGPGSALADLEAKLASGWHDVFGGAGHALPGRSPPPSGTVTFLWTEIASSAELWEAEPEAMEDAHTRHGLIVGRVVSDHHGYVFAATGRGVASAFSSVEHALEAAISAQHALAGEPWPDQTPLRVGMALHTGDAVERNGDYFGPVLNIGSRIALLAHGGQILTSGLTADLAPPSVRSRSLGRHRISGIDGPQRLCQILGERLAADFPALRGSPASPSNLPEATTSFVGRESELAQLLGALDAHRLVTVFGSGGMGKTRLAVEVGRQLRPADGVLIVELGRLNVGEDLEKAMAAQFNISPSSSSGLRDSIIGWLADRDMVLILDNCEHLIEHAAGFAADVAARTGNVKVLATSREPLAITGEHLLPLGSLDTEARDDDRSSAVELFVDRASDENPDFNPATHLRAIMEICQRLDGIPLAIELAAARTRVMTPLEIEGRLGERFRLLTGGRRDALERQQTLHATVDWSYQLLDDLERAVFDHLSVFAGPFTLRDAVAVASGETRSEHQVTDALFALVDRSLVALSDNQTPYRILETLRAFGKIRLADRDEADLVRGAHAEHFHSKAIEMERLAWSPDQLAAVSEILGQGDDYLNAARWAIDHDDLELAADLLVRVAEPTNDTTWWGPRMVIRQLVDQSPPNFPRRWPRLCAHAAGLAIFRDGDYEAAHRYTASGFNRDPADGYCHSIAGLAEQFQGRGQAALEHARQAGANLSDADPRLLQIASVFYVFALSGLDHLTEAASVAEEFAAATARIGAPTLLAWSHITSALTLTGSDPERALAIYDEVEATIDDLDNHGLRQQLARDRARALLLLDPVRAAEQLKLCLDDARMHDKLGFSIAALANVPFVLHKLGDDVGAATIAGSGFSQGLAHHHFEVGLRAQAIDEIREDLDDESYRAASVAGSELPIDELTDFAIDRLTIAGPRRSRFSLAM